MTSNKIIPFARPWITDVEKEAVMKVLSGDVLTHGPQSKAFEEEFSAFVGGGTSCVVSSGMAALHLAYLELKIGVGDEVIVPALTHTATAHAVEAVGARPIFVDCELTTGNIDISKLESLIGPKTKAISLVHFLGIPCDMDPIVQLANKYQLKIVEDCALALGSTYKGKHVGLIGDVGCFSFYPIKHITTGEGGMFLSRHHDLAERAHKTRAFGVDRSFSERSLPGMYDVLSFGLNYRMSDINAALGRAQLSRIKEILRLRKRNFERLEAALRAQNIQGVLQSPSKEFENSYYCLSVILDAPHRPKRTAIVNRLKEQGVGTSVYYPQPVPRMSYYREKYGYHPEQFPNATVISDGSLALPVGPHLTNEDVDTIANIFGKTLKELT